MVSLKQKQKIKHFFAAVIFLAAFVVAPNLSVAAGLPLGAVCAADPDCESGYCNAADGCVESPGTGLVYSTLSEGSSGDEVKILQLALGFSGADVDGRYGPKTKQAVTAWQQSKNLKVDGIAGPETLRSLGIYGGSSGNNSGSNSGNNGGASGACPGGLVKDSGSGLCLPPNSQGGLAGSNTLMDLITKIIDFLLLIGGVVAVIFIIIGGFWYLTSAGNEEQAEKGKKALINSLIGLVVVLMSYAIVTIISNAIGSDDTGAGSGSGNNTTTTRRPGVNEPGSGGP